MSKFQPKLSLVSLDDRIVPSITSSASDIHIMGSIGSTSVIETSAATISPNVTTTNTAMRIANLDVKGDLVAAVRKLDQDIQSLNDDIASSKVLMALVDTAITLTNGDLRQARGDLASLKLLGRPQSEIDAKQKQIDGLEKKLVDLSNERQGYEDQLCEETARLYDLQMKRTELLDQIDAL